MNGLPPMDKGPEDIDEYYRRASALDPSGPTETVRRGILAHAAQLAAARARQRSAPGRGWKPALVGSLMAAGLAGLLMTPHFRIPTPSSQNAAPASAAKQAAPSETQSISVQAQRILKPAAPRAPVPQAMSPAMSPPDLESRAAGGAEPYALRQQNQSPARAEAYSDKAARTAASTAAVTSSPVIGASDPGRALRRAAQAGDIAAVQLLIDQHADIESRDAGGRPQRAVRSGRRIAGTRR
jgi:hypothetical protein